MYRCLKSPTYVFSIPMFLVVQVGSETTTTINQNVPTLDMLSESKVGFKKNYKLKPNLNEKAQ